ncbi:MAG: transcription termination factor Rho, partial [Candidatus Didemnitutus sp.]|nr:transcription termination factor Rho [Candidatus Didemnitutus sp.]
MPPKSSEDTESTSSAPDSAEGSKKRPRARSRLYRSKSKKAAASEGDAAAPAPASTESAAPREERAAKPESRPEPAESAKPARQEAAEQAPASQEAKSDSGDSSASSEQGGQSSHGDASGQQGQQGGDHGGQQQQHQQHQQGGGKFNRWRDKKFRGGGKWGKHGGGGGGGHQNNGPKHPPQPPPPKGEIYFGEIPDPSRFTNLEAMAKLADEIADQNTAPIWLNELYDYGHAELTAKARSLGATFDVVPNRKQLLSAIFNAATEQKIPLLDQGWLDLTDDGFGFVVHQSVNYRVYPENSYLPELFTRKHGLKRGHHVEVQVKAPQGNDRCPSVVAIRSVMGGTIEALAKVKPFEELTPYYPLKRIWLEMQGAKDVSMRMVDIITPVGFGQRGLIVAPPRTGKTVLLQNMANSIAANSPECKLIILLIDERPEEVTDFRRQCKGEVISSTFDETPESHVHCAEMVIEKARRLVELGEHVIILLDSITRLARAYNALASNSGKIMSGGIEATALQKPKRFFGSARNIEGAGSLTILGTALVDTGSRMDEVIFEEFKGTGNS